MAIYRIISTNNTIVAEDDFVKKHYPNDYELVSDPPPPAPEPMPLTKLQFVRLCQSAGGMTKEMTAEAVKSEDMEYFWLMFELAEVINPDDPDTEAGLAALEQLGYLPKGAQAVLEEWDKN